MSSAFQQNRDNAYRDVMLSEDYFAERVLLLTGVGLSVEDETELDTAIAEAIAADQYITCSISEEDEDPIVDDSGLVRSEEIIVQCCRDPVAVSSSGEKLGGIRQPTLHDGILRGTDRDPDQRPFWFVREAKGFTTVLYRLVYRRHVIGTKRMVV